MKRPDKNLEGFVARHLHLFKFKTPTQREMDLAEARIVHQLRSAPWTERHEERQAVVMVPRPTRRYRRLAVLVAAVTLSVVFGQQLVRTPAPPPPPPPPAPRPPLQITALQQQPERTDPPKVVPVLPPQQFAAVSIRIMPPRTPAPSYGLACRGTDGVKRVVLTIRPGLDGISAPQGRCVGTGIFLSTLIEMAYGIPMFQVSGGPDWSQTVGRTTAMNFGGVYGGLTTLGVFGTPEGFSWYEAESFRFEAVADNPGTATLDQLRQMLRVTLEDRFKLRYHIDQKEVPGYSLVIAEGGHKMTPVSGEFVESLVIFDGRSTMEQLADSLRQPAGGLVIDKTGLQGPFEYKLIQSPPTGGGRGGDGGGRGGPEPGGPAFALSADLEKQLGLRLQAEKAIPIKVLVIDSVEKAAPN
jgi:uncharacterized protein (TIGR03435 family)